MGDASHSGCVVLVSKSNERTRFVRMTDMRPFVKALSYRITAEPRRYIRMKVGEVRSFQPDVQCPLNDEMVLKRRINTEYTGLFEPNSRVKTNADGWGTFTCRPGSLEVWIPYIPAAR